MKNKLIAGALVLSLSLGVYSSLRPAQVVKVVEKLGANFDFSSNPFMNFGGVGQEYRSVAFAGTATSTPCVFQVAATSTLVFASLTIDNASSTATTWYAAKSTGSNATTTLLSGPFSLGSGAQGTMVASTTVGGVVDDKLVFSPNQYLVWGVTGLTYTGYDATKLGGRCKAKFIVN